MDKASDKKAPQGTLRSKVTRTPQTKPSSSGVGSGTTPTTQPPKTGRFAVKTKASDDIQNQIAQEHEWTDQVTDALRIQNLETAAGFAKELAMRDRQALLKQISDVQKKRQLRRNSASTTEKSSLAFGREALRKMEDALCAAVSSIKQNSTVLDGLVEEDYADIEEERQLREQLALLETQSKLKQVSLEYDKRPGGGEAEEDPDVEEAKFRENPKYIIKFPIGNPKSWKKDKDKWIGLLKLFVEIIRNQLCEPADYPKDLKVWVNKDKPAEPDTQKMLEKYLLKYLEDYEDEILGHVCLFKGKDFLQQFKNSISNKEKAYHSLHYSGGRELGDGSYFLYYYLAILKHMDVELSKNRIVEEESPQVETAETNDDEALAIEWSVEAILDYMLPILIQKFESARLAAAKASAEQKVHHQSANVSHGVQKVRGAGGLSIQGAGQGSSGSGNNINRADMQATSSRAHLTRSGSVGDFSGQGISKSATVYADEEDDDEGATAAPTTPLRLGKAKAPIGKSATEQKPKPSSRY